MVQSAYWHVLCRLLFGFSPEAVNEGPGWLLVGSFLLEHWLQNSHSVELWQIVSSARYRPDGLVVPHLHSTVHNIYASNALATLAEWDPKNEDAESNTIDRHLQNAANLRVVVALPFLVGHDEGINSSLWGFENTQYVQWIEDAQSKLLDLYFKFMKN